MDCIHLCVYKLKYMIWSSVGFSENIIQIMFLFWQVNVIELI